MKPLNASRDSAKVNCFHEIRCAGLPCTVREAKKCNQQYPFEVVLWIDAKHGISLALEEKSKNPHVIIDILAGIC